MNPRKEFPQACRSLQGLSAFRGLQKPPKGRASSFRAVALKARELRGSPPPSVSFTLQTSQPSRAIRATCT